MVDVPGAVVFNIAFSQLDLEFNSDFLYYGNSTSPSTDEALGRFTGYNLPPDLEIRGQTIWFIFTSDFRSAFLGFFLTWRTTGQ